MVDRGIVAIRSASGASGRVLQKKTGAHGRFLRFGTWSTSKSRPVDTRPSYSAARRGSLIPIRTEMSSSNMG